jgi:hypothetical protein
MATQLNHIVGERPIFSTGDKSLDGVLTIGIGLVSGTFILDVLYCLWRAWCDHGGYGRRTRSGMVSKGKRDAWLLLVLAAISFIIVNWVRTDMEDVLFGIQNTYAALYYKISQK